MVKITERQKERELDFCLLVGIIFISLEIEEEESLHVFPVLRSEHSHMFRPAAKTHRIEVSAASTFADTHTHTYRHTEGPVHMLRNVPAFLHQTGSQSCK